MLTSIIYWISYSYLTGVTAAQLQWHLSNMNENDHSHILTDTFARLKISEKLPNEALEIPTLGIQLGTNETPIP